MKTADDVLVDDVDAVADDFEESSEAGLVPEQFFDAFRMRGEMIRRGAEERVRLVNRIAKLEAELVKMATTIARLT